MYEYAMNSIKLKFKLKLNYSWAKLFKSWLMQI